MCCQVSKLHHVHTWFIGSLRCTFGTIVVVDHFKRLIMYSSPSSISCLSWSLARMVLLQDKLTPFTKPPPFGPCDKYIWSIALSYDENCSVWLIVQEQFSVCFKDWFVRAWMVPLVTFSFHCVLCNLSAASKLQGKIIIEYKRIVWVWDWWYDEFVFDYVWHQSCHLSRWLR